MARPAIRKAIRPPASTANGLQASQAPRFSPAFRGRKSSIVLDNDPSNNVILNSNLLKMHKNAPPGTRIEASGRQTMTDQEFTWWSNPFLRMLSSPLRICTLTKRYAPTDHLIRVTATLLAQPGEATSSSTPAYIMPSNLHHPRYAPHPRGQGAYIPCSKTAVPLLTGKGRHRGLFPGAEVHDLLEQQIHSGLQTRCVEEAEILATTLRTTARYRSGEPVAFTVRRLTEEEYEATQQQSRIHDPKVMAVIVAPKVEEGEESNIGTLCKSQLLFRGTGAASGSESMLPMPRIPIYWISSLFSDPNCKAALRKALDSALDSERTAVRTARKSQSKTGNLYNVPYEPKSRDAYAICASRRVDAVPLAIAFWRLRLWEGVDDN
ncbi:hypothetical protein RSOL_511260 [Rhizoctonia solani AG-3 Rhs1AP]|uniref:Uncharacterized protein n=1 Tax=Rhizoctonia solani AG-3 Rhs1AP TaxID=1086054 RepID=X8JUR2_9AGAM|nr:hypothetical protein RSOL_511260 [Rhizoctonia solani AG-3 Rhs1AP]